MSTSDVISFKAKRCVWRDKLGFHLVKVEEIKNKVSQVLTPFNKGKQSLST